mgnify:CR=1 FL=1
MSATRTAVATRTFPGAAASVREASRWVVSCLACCPRAEDAATCVSELAGNAVLHSASGAADGTYTVTVRLSATSVSLTVVDQGPVAVPGQVRRPAEESGRGMGIVCALADAYERRGTTAWCRLDWDGGSER